MLVAIVTDQRGASRRRTSQERSLAGRDCDRLRKWPETRAPCFGHVLDVIGAGSGHRENPDRGRAGYRSIPIAVRLHLYQRGGCGQHSGMARGSAE